MSKDEIDIMWQKAMCQSIEDGEMFTRYHFAKLVAEKERETCLVELNSWGDLCEDAGFLADKIRARKQA